MMNNEYEEEDDGDPEVTPHPTDGSPPAVTFTATVSRDEIVRMVAERAYVQLGRGNTDGIEKAARTVIRDLVRERAREEIERVVAEGVSEVARAMVVGGWPKTDEYGRPCGTVTVRDIVIEFLAKRDSYGDRMTRMEQWVKRLFEEAFKQELTPLLEEAKKQVRSLLDRGVAGAIKKALLEGAGIRE